MATNGTVLTKWTSWSNDSSWNASEAYAGARGFDLPKQFFVATATAIDLCQPNRPISAEKSEFMSATKESDLIGRLQLQLEF